MPFVSPNRMLARAKREKFAIGAFNIENMEMAQAVIEAASDMQSPIILATSESALRYADPNTFYQMILSLCKDVDIDVSIHLDHGTSYNSVIRSLRAGYSSVMIDGSKLTYKENVDLTSKVTDICHEFHVSVEAELGAIVGKACDAGRKMILTSPEMAVDFVEKTHCDSLAVAIGTSHGFYKQTPKLDYERLFLIHEQCEVPLVLHGASGLTEEQLLKCIANGISKINFATELRQTYTSSIVNMLKCNPNIVDPKVYGESARNKVKDLVKQKIEVLGSRGKSSYEM